MGVRDDIPIGCDGIPYKPQGKRLFAALARAEERRLGAFIAQELANTAWAFRTATQLDAVPFVALARAMEQRLGAFIAQKLAKTAWAFGTAAQTDAMLFMASAGAV